MNPHLRSIAIVAVAVLSFGVAGCASGGPARINWADPAVDLAWPAPPERARIRFLRTIAPADFVEKEGQGQKLWRLFTGEQPEVLPLAGAYGVAADGDGRVWVADSGTRVVHIFDLARHRVDYLGGAGDALFESPAGVAYDREARRLYVSDTVLGQVFAFDDRGRLVGTPSPPAGYGRPAGLAVDSRGSLYVVDAVRGKVEVFSREGSHLRSVESDLPPDGVFNLPSNVAVAGDGRIHVVDSMNFRVETFAPDGTSLGTVGEIGNVPGSFARPRGVAVDSEGHLYVADATFGNIQVFDAAGRLLLYFGTPGEKPGQFSLPAGLFFDVADRLYVADAYNGRIQVFQYLPGEEP